MKYHIFFSLLFLTLFPHQTHSAEPDTLRVIDIDRVSLGEPPVEWKHILPKKHYVYSNYTIERSIDGPYLRARSNSTASWLEIKLNDIDVTKYNIMAWQWKVDSFPDVKWEQESANDDFAIRIELVYDLKGSYKNPLNILRKGLIKSIFKRYPPELIISYVWAVNVPTGKSYVSPNSNNTIVIPVESSKYIKELWIKERWDIEKDLKQLYKDHNLVLKKIRLRSDTDDSSSIAESGLKYIYFIAENP